ncbi:MAG: ABC transporter substrate-binding protein [Chitinophagaceae bacterium]|nr:ABC transporter substrate-binding protein [Chitinophagaceae bacterium]
MTLAANHRLPLNGNNTNTMRIKVTLLFILLSIFQLGQIKAQTIQNTRIHIALFVPLYLDSAFVDQYDTYSYGKNFPKQSIPGLDFYLGAEAALDSLAILGIPITLNVFDIKSKSGNINTIAQTPLMDSIDLIVGPVTGSDFIQLTQLANQKNIPFVSASYPNDGGLKKSPNLIIVNSKLNTHIQSTYNYVARNLIGYKIIYLRRQNPIDDKVSDVIKTLNTTSTGQLLNIKTVQVDELFTIDSLSSNLDSLRNNVIIVGSLDETFGLSMVTNAALIAKNYALTIVGMPTWGNIKDLTKPEFNPLPIIYSASFFNDLSNPWSVGFEEKYRNKSYSKPTDMAYRGYELIWNFTNLLKKYGKKSLLNNLSDKSFKIMSDFDFKPVNWSKTNTFPDYYENKKVIILKRLGGTVSRIN